MSRARSSPAVSDFAPSKLIALEPPNCPNSHHATDSRVCDHRLRMQTPRKICTFCIKSNTFCSYSPPMHMQSLTRPCIDLAPQDREGHPRGDSKTTLFKVDNQAIFVDTLTHVFRLCRAQVQARRFCLIAADHPLVSAIQENSVCVRDSNNRPRSLVDSLTMRGSFCFCRFRTSSRWATSGQTSYDRTLYTALNVSASSLTLV